MPGVFLHKFTHGYKAFTAAYCNMTVNKVWGATGKWMAIILPLVTEVVLEDVRKCTVCRLQSTQTGYIHS